jgi:transcriptional regulator with XRE-family HTH domain
MTGDDTSARWAAGCADVLATRIRHRRAQLRWSAADLAEACVAVGYPIPRNVLLKLESGVRRYATTSELFVLAAALGVPPVWLLLPVGGETAFEYLPGCEMPVDQALRWVDGTEGVGGMDQPDGTGVRRTNPDALQTLRLIRLHHDAVGRVTSAREDALAPVRQKQLLEPDELLRALATAVEDARTAERAAGAAYGRAFQAASESLAEGKRHSAAPIKEYQSQSESARERLQVALQEEVERREQVAAVQGVVSIRRAIRARSEVPPALPAGLGWIDAEGQGNS